MLKDKLPKGVVFVGNEFSDKEAELLSSSGFVVKRVESIESVQNLHASESSTTARASIENAETIGDPLVHSKRKQMEDALREREEHFKTLHDTMLQGAVYQDADGSIISMNPAAIRILGKTPEEFLCETSTSVEHHTQREDGTPFPGIEHPAMVALKTGREVRDVVMGVYNPRESQIRWINISAVPLFRKGESKPNQVYTIFDDITDRKRAEHSLRQQKELLMVVAANTRAHLVYLDRDFNFVWVNQAYADACARSPEDFIGYNHFDFYPNEENQAIFEQVRDTGVPFEVKEKPFIFPDHPEWG